LVGIVARGLKAMEFYKVIQLYLLLCRKKAIDMELAEIEPLIQEAGAAVGNIKPESLSEIRSLRAPPDISRDLLEGVLRLMGILDTSWNSMKTFLAKRGIKEEIRY
jgi:dynein heavy chain 2